MAEKLNATLSELVARVSGDTSDDRVLGARLRWAQRFIAKQHYSAVHAESVHEVFENGLLERLAVLGRPDLADLLRDKLNDLDKQDYVTAQVLLLMKQLSLNPETRVTKAQVRMIRSGRTVSDEQLKTSLAIDELMDGLADDVENWNTNWAFTEEANAMYMEDDDYTDETRSPSPVPEDEEPRSGGNDEFKLLFHAIQGNGESLPDPSGGNVDVELQQFYEQSYWNAKVIGIERPIIISESTAVREIILALRGYPSMLIVKSGAEYTVTETYRVLHFSRPMFVEILIAAREELLSVSRIRSYLEIQKPSLIQVFDSAVDELILAPFYEELYSIEGSIVFSDSRKITSLSNLLRTVQSITKTWAPVLQIIDNLNVYIQQNPHYDARYCFATILSDLYTATKSCHYEFLSLPQKDSSFTKTLQVFSRCMDHYCGVELDAWMRAHDTLAYKPQFFVGDLPSYKEAMSYWTFKYRVEVDLVPEFLRPLAQYIYEAGLSLRFLNEVKEISGLQQRGLGYEEAVGALVHPDLWWIKLHLQLEKWVLSNHHVNAQKLLDCVYESRLTDLLKTYAEFYLMLDNKQPVMTYFLDKTFARLDRGLDKVDKFLVQEDFFEALKLIPSSAYEGEEEDQPEVLIAQPPVSDVSDSSSALKLLGRFRLEVPVSWVVKEVLGSSAKLYQSQWTLLLQWAYAHHVVTRIHLSNLSSPKRYKYAALSHCVLVFTNKIREYFHISVHRPAYAKAKHIHASSLQPSNLSDDAGGDTLLLSFQDLIDTQEEFIYGTAILCFLETSDAFICNIKACLDKILDWCITDLPAIITGDGELKGDDAEFYGTAEYFSTSKIAPFQKALKLALANNSFEGVNEKTLLSDLVERLD